MVVIIAVAFLFWLFVYLVSLSVRLVFNRVVAEALFSFFFPVTNLHF